MKITRTENSISWQDGHSAGTVGVVESHPIDMKDNALHEEWIAYCADRAVANAHTIAETIAWMEVQWDVEPLDNSDERVKNAYGSVVEHFCADMLTHHPGEFSLEMTDEEFTRWHHETEARREEAATLPVEKTGIALRGYRIPPTRKNLPDIEAGLTEHFAASYEEPVGDQPKPKPSDCYVIFEETHPNMIFSGVGIAVIARRLIGYVGIDQEDIETRSPRFLSYIHEGFGTPPTFAQYRNDSEKQ